MMKFLRGYQMASFNKIILMGNLTRDPELRYAPSGTAICNIDIAVNDGHKKDAEPLYIRIIAFNKQAESCGQYLRKGSGIMAEGRLQISSWDGDGGVKRTRPEVVAQTIQFLSNKGDQPSPMDSNQIDNNDIPF
jgi:single-strand DNA-binding protein